MSDSSEALESQPDVNKDSGKLQNPRETGKVGVLEPPKRQDNPIQATPPQSSPAPQDELDNEPELPDYAGDSLKMLVKQQRRGVLEPSRWQDTDPRNKSRRHPPVFQDDTNSDSGQEQRKRKARKPNTPPGSSSGPHLALFDDARFIEDEQRSSPATVEALNPQSRLPAVQGSQNSPEAHVSPASTARRDSQESLPGLGTEEFPTRVPSQTPSSIPGFEDFSVAPLQGQAQRQTIRPATPMRTEPQSSRRAPQITINDEPISTPPPDNEQRIHGEGRRLDLIDVVNREGVFQSRSTSPSQATARQSQSPISPAFAQQQPVSARYQLQPELTSYVPPGSPVLPDGRVAESAYHQYLQMNDQLQDPNYSARDRRAIASGTPTLVETAFQRQSERQFHNMGASDPRDSGSSHSGLPQAGTPRGTPSPHHPNIAPHPAGLQYTQPKPSGSALPYGVQSQPRHAQSRPSNLGRESVGYMYQRPQPARGAQGAPKAPERMRQISITDSMARVHPGNMPSSPGNSTMPPNQAQQFVGTGISSVMPPGSFYHGQTGSWYAPASSDPPEKYKKLQKEGEREDIGSFTAVSHLDSRPTAGLRVNDYYLRDDLQVLEYLSKKGYVRTEAKLREETALQQDANGRPIQRQSKGPERYEKSFELLKKWVEDTLDVYKPELARLLWPIFVYAYLTLARDHFQKQAGDFFEKHKDLFAREHTEDVRAMGNICSPQHVQDNKLAQIYMKNKYRLTLTESAYNIVILFLESIDNEGGSAIITLMADHMYIKPVDRAALGNERSLASMLAKGGAADDMPAEDEGIPGHNPGSANTTRDMDTLPRLHLGQLPMDADLMDDVRDHLQEEDEKAKPAPGQNSLVEQFEQRIKLEPMEDGPSREHVPLPPPLARDVMMEVQKVKENRDRFRIEAKTGGIGPGISVTMYTLHNTYDSVCCLDFSPDYTLIAIGTDQSYIRVWSIDGSALPSSTTDPPNSKPASSRRLIGHSGPVYTVAFSPGTKKPDPDGPPTHSRYLISCSADKTVRLWSLDLWQCLVAYRGHERPVWDVSWGPHGHYFLTGSGDMTARMWSTDRIDPLRIFQGHEQDVDVVGWHPNGAYTFTASSDRTVRMWDVNRGTAVRMFTGHTGNITSLACAPDAKTLASADDHGLIILWDLATGRRTKVMRGHARGGIWSLAWSVESTVLVSGAADGTVRVWDVFTKPDAATNGKVAAEGGAGIKIDGAGGGAAGPVPVGSGGGVGSVGGAGKKGKKGEVTVSPDQISAFPTKKSPVYKVVFTGMNLCLAGGAYLP